MKKLLVSITSLALLICSSITYAESEYLGESEPYEYVENPAASEPQYTDPTGVQVKFNNDGSWRAILATGEAELVFGDRKDISQAIKKATMRAKASIAKFMGESLQSEDTYKEITDTISSTTSAGESSAVRDTVEQNTETIVNKSNQILQGIVTLKQDILREEKYVMVVLGVKQQTIDAAVGLGQNLDQGLNDIKKSPKSSTNSQNSPSSRSSDNEVRKSEMYDNF